MVEHIQNPRRASRTSVRCRVALVSVAGTFEAQTEDLGGLGCQLVSPRLVRKGEPIQLQLSHPRLKESLRVGGRVAWASERTPWRLGIAFDASVHGEATRWFERLLAADPHVPQARRIPDRLPVDAIVYLASPPRFLVDFTPDEAALLRAIGSGVPIAELRARLRDRWPKAQRSLFSLLAHQHATLSRGASVHPDAWKQTLAGLEASLAVDELEPCASPGAAHEVPPVRTPTPAPRTDPQVRPIADRTRRQADAPAAPWIDPSVAWPAAGAGWQQLQLPQHARPGTPGRAASPGPGRPTASVAPGDPGYTCTPPPLTGSFPLTKTPRSTEAQACFDRARAELDSGRMMGGLALLRRALALAPGDPEIGAALAEISPLDRP